MRDLPRDLFVELVKAPDPFDELRPILGGIRLPPRRVKPRAFIGFVVSLGELLDAIPADVDVVGDVLGVELVIDNESTDPGDFVLGQPHFIGSMDG